MRAFATALAIGVLAATAGASKMSEAADEVVAAWKAKDQEALAALAAKTDPGPWLVADELCARGAQDVAEAYVKAVPAGKDTEKLAAYVASRPGRTNEAARAAIAEANEAFRAREIERGLAILMRCEDIRPDVASAGVLYGRGIALRVLKRFRESAEAYAEAGELAERIGWLARAASAFGRSGASAQNADAWQIVTSSWERRRAIEEIRGNRMIAAKTLNNLVFAYFRLGEPEMAIDRAERALELLEELGNRKGMAAALGNLGAIHRGLGAYLDALDCQQRSLAIEEELGNREGAATSLLNIGNIYFSLGALDKALDYQQRGLAIEEELGDRGGVAIALGNIGATHEARGAYAKALEYQQRSLEISEEIGDRLGVVAALANLGTIHGRLGAYAKALEYQRKSLKLAEGMDDPGRVAAALINIGNTESKLGNDKEALEYLQRARQIEEKIGNRPAVASVLADLGTIHEGLGDSTKALECEERALKLMDDLGDRAGAAATLVNMGIIHHGTGANEKALACLERAEAQAGELGLVDTRVTSLMSAAQVLLALGKPADAARKAHDAVAELPLLVGRLAEEHGASARGRWAKIFDAGLRAAARLDDPAKMTFFMESGRAGALLESLGGRAALADVVIPAELRDAEVAARAGVIAAEARYSRETERGKLKAIRAARAGLDEARKGVLDVVARIQSEAKTAAGVAYPEADALAEIQARLRDGDALVLYALPEREPLALVVTRKRARSVPLGDRAAIVDACGAVQGRLADGASRGSGRPQAESGAAPGALATLRKLVVEPLGLGAEIKRLLVSPAGPLAYVPFVLLAGDRDVAYVPSGTAYGLLLEERAKRGAGVLAVGDPDYDAPRDAAAGALHRGGAALVRLPATGAEAKAVGTTTLLRDQATEAGFDRAVAAAPRWRAVHLACHGLVDADRPMLSSLALTPDPDHDGFLTVLEVFRSRIPADLVVLSACETAKGKAYEAEGIVGFTRAFMFAGAPRVIVSLWKVDDEATRALMVKFYELWNPKDAAKGLPAATALRKAQDFIRGQERWRDPYYWAAWQLWGLAD